MLDRAAEKVNARNENSVMIVNWTIDQKIIAPFQR